MRLCKALGILLLFHGAHSRVANPKPDPAFSAVELVEGPRDAGLLFLCDHASAALPAEYGDLGLPATALQRHIAYDIGAADVTRALAAKFNAPAVLTGFSRLLIDPNRGADDPTLVMRLSDGAIVRGNAGVDAAEIARRIALYWQPYRDRVRALLDEMAAVGPVPAIVSIHSFTPVWKDHERPWQFAILWDKDPRLAVPLIGGLRAQGHVVGDNEPYDGALLGDTLHEHGTSRGLAHVLIELRQDLISTRAQAEYWAEALVGPLAASLSSPDVHQIKHYGSRADLRAHPHPETLETT